MEDEDRVPGGKDFQMESDEKLWEQYGAVNRK